MSKRKFINLYVKEEINSDLFLIHNKGRIPINSSIIKDLSPFNSFIISQIEEKIKINSFVSVFSFSFDKSIKESFIKF